LSYVFHFYDLFLWCVFIFMMCLWCVLWCMMCFLWCVLWCMICFYDVLYDVYFYDVWCILWCVCFLWCVSYFYDVVYDVWSVFMMCFMMCDIKMMYLIYEWWKWHETICHSRALQRYCSMISENKYKKDNFLGWILG